MTAAEARELANENQLSVEQNRSMLNLMYAVKEEAKKGAYNVRVKWTNHEHPFNDLLPRLYQLGYKVSFEQELSIDENSEIWQISWE